jgi:ATP-binding cassette subfamily C protein
MTAERRDSALENNEKNSFLDLFLSLVAHAWTVYRWKLLTMVALMTIVALGEGLGMVLLLPLLAALGVSAPSEGNWLMSWLQSALNYFGIGTSTYLIAMVMLFVFATHLILSLVQSWWISYLQRDYGAYWQKRVSDSLLYSEWGLFAEYKLGYLTSLVTHDTNRLSGALYILMQILSLSVTALVYVIAAALISWQVTSLVVIMSVFLSFSVKGIGTKIFGIGGSIGPLTARFNELVTEYFGGIKLIKATSSEHVAAAQLNVAIHALRVQHTWAAFLPSSVRSIFEFGSIAALCFILIVGSQHYNIAASNIFVVFALFVRLLPRFNSLQQNIQLIGNFIPALSDIMSVVKGAEARSERGRYSDNLFLRENVGSGNLVVSIRRAGYGELMIINDIHLNFPEKGVVAIAGTSGAGKTTLANCILGLIRVTEGDLFFGGKNIKDMPLNVWRQQIGYVSQEVALFHSSVRDNIAWGKPFATDDEIISVAKQALAHDFIMQQPLGYQTIIGDRGSRLSGGQRQRLGIARALLARPKLMVLDEATSALDSISEIAILETINRIKHKTCVVMIAHRLTTIKNADFVVLMEGGTVVEMGTWQELLDRKDRFFKFTTSQSMNHKDSH